jgi:hypothetical protein
MKRIDLQHSNTNLQLYKQTLANAMKSYNVTEDNLKIVFLNDVAMTIDYWF